MAAPFPARRPIAFLEHWLSCAERPRTADVLFVLAGADDRKLYALDLYREGIAPILLFSVARYDIRRFSKMPLPVPLNLLEIAAPTPAPLRHFFVLFASGSVEVEYVQPKRLGTMTEVAALGRWLERHPEVQSLLLLSNAIHLRRIRLCCRSVLPRTVCLTFMASPDSSTADSSKEKRMARARPALLELTKLIGYWIGLRFRAH